MFMKVSQTALSEVLLIEPNVFEDERGFFLESYHADKWKQLGVDYPFVQDNHSLSVRAGTIRGLHYQLEPYAQTKLVRVVVGAIYDVAVDIRHSSPTFGQWIGVILSASNHRQLLIPQGFAHGFCTLVSNTEVLYKVDAPYHAASDRGIAWDDPAINIAWPVNNPILSEKDGKHPLLNDAELSSGLSALHARDKGGAAE